MPSLQAITLAVAQLYSLSVYRLLVQIVTLTGVVLDPYRIGGSCDHLRLVRASTASSTIILNVTIQRAECRIHLYHNRLVGYFARQQVFELPRIRVSGKGRRRGRCIDYRHLVGGLRKKPRAFLYCTWQDDLLPTAEFRQLWEQLKNDFERDTAAILIVEALYIAATYDQEQAVCDYLSAALAEGNLTLSRLQQQFMPDLSAVVPPIETQQHALDSYDQLLSSNPNTVSPASNSVEATGEQQQQSIPAIERPAQTAQAHSHAYPLGSYREPRFTAAMVLCTVFVELVRTRGRQTGTGSSEARHKRSSATRRKKFYDL